MATMLHALLAVEPSKEGYFKKAIPEMVALFKNKTSHFWGATRTLSLFGEETPEKIKMEQAEMESQSLTTTVPAELEYLKKVCSEFFDVTFQKDEANGRAIADIVVDGNVLVSNVPAITLLALENRLKQLREVYDAIPTLQPGVDWEKALDLGKFVWRDKNVEVRTKTKKGFDFKVLVPATDKHQAQVEKWDTQEPVGTYSKIRWCGMLSVSDKSALLERLDKVSNAVKIARQNANAVNVNTSLHIGDSLFGFIHNFE